MARNIKLGSDTITNTNTITVDDADTPNTEDTFYCDDLFEYKMVSPQAGNDLNVLPTGTGMVALEGVTVRAVTMESLVAQNIRDGATVKVGTSLDDDSIARVDGSYTRDADVAIGSETSVGSGIYESSDILSGKYAYGKGKKLIGTYSGVVPTGNVDITTTDEYNVAGKATARISATERNKIVEENIRYHEDILGVQGAFTKANTVSSGQTAATASQIFSGYSAWVDGAEVRGNVTTKTASDVTVNGSIVNIPAGAYASAVSKQVEQGIAQTPATTISTTPTMSGAVSGNYYVVTATNSKTQSITPTVVAGYVINGTSGTITVSGSNTFSIPIYDGTVV